MREHVFAIDHGCVSCIAYAMRRSFNFKDLIWSLHSAQDRVARKASYWVCWSGPRRGSGRIISVQNGELAQLLFEKAPWRGEELQRPLFLPAKRGASSAEPPFSGRLAYGKESVKGTLLPRLINIVVVRCWAAADRSPAADIVLELRSSYY